MSGFVSFGGGLDKVENLLSVPVWVVLGGQFGSEGKGAFIGWLSDPNNPRNILNSTGLSRLAIVRTGGPQAGHSILYNGNRYAMRQVPCGWFNIDAQLFIGPGALIDVDVLLKEIREIEAVTGKSLDQRLFIDARATIVEEKHREAERDLVKGIGSTGEGVGAAQADKVMRKALVASGVSELTPYLADVGAILRDKIRSKDTAVIVESTQGWGLSLNSSFYPTVTSRDITPAQVLNDAGIPSNYPHGVILVMRTYPIRVAGPSGDMVGAELTWEQLSAGTNGYIKPERTTVTNRVRRIARWSDNFALKAIDACNPDAIALSFFDYLRPDLASKNLDRKAEDFIEDLGGRLNTPVLWASTGFQEWIPTDLLNCWCPYEGA